MPVQLRFDTGLAGDECVTRELWRSAALEHCPLHPEGGCGFARHGLYERKSPSGTFIARWYCPRGHRTFSLLPDHLAARFPGTLAQIERVVEAADTRTASLQACADALRPDPVSLLDPLGSTSRQIDPTVVGEEPCNNTRAVQVTLQRYKELRDVVAILGMVELSPADKLAVARARKIERLLSQPFHLADVFTGTPGKYVPLKETPAASR